VVFKHTELSPVPVHGQNLGREVQGFKPPSPKHGITQKKVYYGLVTQDKVLLMKTRTYFANKMALKRYEIKCESCLFSFKPYN
jgi:hypothetical protein